MFYLHFYRRRFWKCKKTVKLSFLFVLAGSAHAKAAHRGLMKLTAGTSLQWTQIIFPYFQFAFKILWKVPLNLVSTFFQIRHEGAFRQYPKKLVGKHPVLDVQEFDSQEELELMTDNSHALKMQVMGNLLFFNCRFLCYTK